MLIPEHTFCHVPFCEDLNTLGVDQGADVAVLGAPHGTPYTPGEASHAVHGAKAVREALAWYATGREQFDFDSLTSVMGAARVVDCGDVAGSLRDGAENRAAIAAATRVILERGALPLLLGGDDSVPIPFIEAFSEAGSEGITVVQVDAHIDWRHEVDGVTHGFSSTMRRASEMAHVTGMVQIGARGPGSARRAEYDDARAWGSKIFTARDVHAEGLGPALAAVPDNASVILAIDVDGLDPTLVPGVILPAFGGLTYQQMLDVIEGIAARARIIGATFVEYVPEKDPAGSGAQAIARLACNVISAVAGQRRA